jgi:hypothetical protein
VPEIWTLNAKNMTTEQAKQLVERLRPKAHGRTGPESDLALLRSLAEADENVSFMLTAMCGLVLAMQSGWSWWDVGFVAVLAYIVHCRWEMLRLREAMRLFEDRGAQKVQEI